MKIKENQVSNISIYLRDIHSITSPPAKLCYILVVYTKSSGWLANKYCMTSHSTSGRNNNTVDVLVLKGKTFFLSFFFSASYNRIIILCNKNILTIAIINLSSSEKHCKQHSNKLKNNKLRDHRSLKFS